jgi:hypothetical protein
MAWPSTVTALTNPLPSQRLNSPSHSSIETAQNTEVTAIETFVGTLSATVGTLVYDIRGATSNGGGHVQGVNVGGTGFTSYTKGDVLVASSASVLAKFGVGTDAQVLIADSTQTSGVKWGANPWVPSAQVPVETSIARWSSIMTNGTGTHNTTGIQLTTTATSGSLYRYTWIPFSSGNEHVYRAGNWLSGIMYVSQSGSLTGDQYWGLGNPAVSAAAFTFTANHAGYKLTVTAATSYTLAATVADGATETATTISTGILNGDVIYWVVEYVSSSSVKFYTWINGTVQTTVTLTTNIPTITDTQVAISATNKNTANAISISFAGGAFGRHI